ncbi:MAG: type III secretion system export apparatus subunit SctU [Myxococcota bacterium]
MASEKTEEATPKKLRDARKRGEVPRSKDLGTAAVVLATAGAMTASAPFVLRTLEESLRLSFRAAAGELPGDPRILRAALSLGVDAALPVVLAALLAGTVVSFLQVGPLVTADPIKPKFERLDPIKGLKNLFSQRQLIELIKTLLKIGIVGAVAWTVLRDGLRGVVSLTGRDALGTLEAAGELVTALMFRVGGALLAVAILDLFYQRWRHRRDQRMSKDEVKREYKESEGDPHAKQQRERLHREIIDHDTVEQVRAADVLVVNPTHIAVALRYEEGVTDAPEVIAQGQEHLARRMIEAAREAGVPIMRDVPLARALFELELGEAIPEALYEAVAAVLKAAWAESEAMKVERR